MNKEYDTDNAERGEEAEEQEINRLFMRRMKWRTILIIPYALIMFFSAYFFREYLGLVQLGVWLEWLGTVSEIAMMIVSAILVLAFCACLSFTFVHLVISPPLDDHLHQLEENRKKWKKG